MPFLFNPCRPCCTIPKCGICGNLSIPRSWNVTFNGNGSDTTQVNNIDEVADTCADAFRPVVASFNPQFSSPCAWKGVGSKVIKTCYLSGTCGSGKCMCDCDTCFDVLFGPIFAVTGGCYNIAYGGGWSKASIGDTINCKWFGASPSLQIQLKKDVPVTLSASISANFGAISSKATYNSDGEACEDFYTFTLAGQTNLGLEATWPQTVKVYRADCASPLPECLCNYCDYSWSVSVDKLEVLQGVIDKWTSTVPWNFGGYHAISKVAWAGGDLPLFNYAPAGNCYFQGVDGFGQNFTDASGLHTCNTTGVTNLCPRGSYLEKPLFSAVTSLVPNIQGGYGTYLRALILTVNAPFYFANFSSNPFSDGGLSMIAQQVYLEDLSTMSSDCDDYTSKEFKLFPLANYRIGDNTCGEVDPGNGTAFGNIVSFLRSNWGYDTGDPQDAVVHWPATVTLNRVAGGSTSPPCPDPYGFLTNQVNTGDNPNSGTTGKFTNDIKTEVEITVGDGVVNAKVTVTYTNRCKNPGSPVVLKDIKNYRMSLSSFDCLGVNGLSLVDSPSGSVCNNWPSSITLTP